MRLIDVNRDHINQNLVMTHPTWPKFFFRGAHMRKISSQQDGATYVPGTLPTEPDACRCCWCKVLWLRCSPRSGPWRQWALEPTVGSYVYRVWKKNVEIEKIRHWITTMGKEEIFLKNKHKWNTIPVLQSNAAWITKIRTQHEKYLYFFHIFFL